MLRFRLKFYFVDQSFAKIFKQPLQLEICYNVLVNFTFASICYCAYAITQVSLIVFMYVIVLMYVFM